MTRSGGRKIWLRWLGSASARLDSRLGSRLGSTRLTARLVAWLNSDCGSARGSAQLGLRLGSRLGSTRFAARLATRLVARDSLDLDSWLGSASLRGSGLLLSPSGNDDDRRQLPSVFCLRRENEMRSKKPPAVAETKRERETSAADGRQTAQMRGWWLRSSGEESEEKEKNSVALAS